MSEVTMDDIMREFINKAEWYGYSFHKCECGWSCKDHAGRKVHIEEFVTGYLTRRELGRTVGGRG